MLQTSVPPDPIQGPVPSGDVLKQIWGITQMDLLTLAVSMPTFLNLHGKAFLQLPEVGQSQAAAAALNCTD